MAIFTNTMLEIMQRNMQTGQDLTTIDGMYAVGAPIFFGSEMNCISQEYREKFEKGFLLKFMDYELAYDAFPRWRLAFQEKIYNNADYINAIYDTLDKQIFADYRVKRVNSEGSSSIVTDVEGGSTSVTDGTVEVANSGTSSETTSNRNVVDEDTTDSNNTTTLGTGTVANAKTGTETTADTGTDTNVHTGTKTTTTDMVHNEEETGSYSDATVHGLTDTNTKTGTETSAASGTDQRDITLVKTGSEQNQDTRNLTHGESGSYRDTNHQVVETDNDGRDNSFQVNYDTPVSQISSMRSPGASSAGTGSSLISSETFNYLSSASEGGNTHIDDNTEQTDGYTERTFTNYQQTDTGTDTNVLSFTNRQDKTDDDVTYGKTDTTTFNTTDRSVKSGTDTTTRTFDDYLKAASDDGTVEDEYNETNTETKNLQSQTTHNTTDTQTRNTSDATTGSSTGTRDVTTTDNGSKSVTDSSTQTTDTDTTVTNTNESNTTQNSTNENESEEIDYAYNMEMIYRSIPLLDKVWDIFYDIFMLIWE